VSNESYHSQKYTRVVQPYLLPSHSKVETNRRRSEHQYLDNGHWNWSSQKSVRGRCVGQLTTRLAFVSNPSRALYNQRVSVGVCGISLGTKVDMVWPTLLGSCAWTVKVLRQLRGLWSQNRPQKWVDLSSLGIAGCCLCRGPRFGRL
jgi:hypothetical protein